MAKPRPYQLLVEGAEDKRVIPELIERHGIVWEPQPKQYIVDIEDCVGVDNIAKNNFIATRFKSSGLQSLGIIIDKDGTTESHPSRVDDVLQRCREIIPDFDWQLKAEGIIATDDKGKRLGLWVMPDNSGPGMLENLLLTLPGEDQNDLLEHARSSTLVARMQRNAPYIAVHQDKAIMHTFLAWQNPPGRQLHQALKEGLLQPHSEIADAFVAWFRELFPAQQETV